ncbi:DUF4982 domain-containing protein [Mucilaginibacter daejeonensis]|uniref:glycoside hydrolase family 2 TIM barrel-domain containing protein n=1 Tax=Mucilaginibacter daejeonensis TaxID=398049 RepID=UPI001D17C59C|nr:glycoside hydrolase family 2 TIM barrel-domain containing protein [Mucilaginibacter daejeonensis]UEG55089.1 DUF4982 domain-containing protein [Mucilaginibacter daejeonensis]
MCRAQNGGRQIIRFNDQWSFSKDPKGTASAQDQSSLNWTKVTLPHTWNDKDVMDDEPGYYRGIGWYKRTLVIPAAFKGKRIYLCFNGANQETEVYVNGSSAGMHIGGYTRFNVDISDLLKPGTDQVNDIMVKVNNRHNDDIAPLSADFTFFGGIYRDVNLLAVEPVHFSTGDHGTDGVYVSTPIVSERSAQVRVKSVVENSSASYQKFSVSTVIYDATNKLITTQVQNVQLGAHQTKNFLQEIKPISDPHLWSPADPYLYRVLTTITDAKTKRIIDQVSNPLGFRWFRFDADKGFFLNGKPLKIMGASRHQDYEGLGNAVPTDLQVRDMQLLKDMGGNFVRIAHYPQDPVILRTCDRLGILASVEIPIVNAITESDAFTRNCTAMQVEMIRQNYNHPSVIIWGYMNEVLLRPKFGNDKARQEQYFGHIRQLAQTLDSLTRKEDPYRYTMIANHGDFDKYGHVGLTKIPMLVGWNLYQGWYSPDLKGFASFLDKHHRELKDKPLLITEYGADADPRIRSFSPVRFDKSIEYAIKYHQIYLNAMLERPFVSGGMAWNLADFNSEPREETMPHINNKGLLTIGRQPKDTYYLYQAYLLNKPFVKIASSSWAERSGVADSTGNTCTQFVQVATNAKGVELFLNGQSLGVRPATDHISTWRVPFLNGDNRLRALDAATGQSDEVVIKFNLLPTMPSVQNPINELNVLLGADRYYIDEHLKQTWVPDRPYQKGSWGYVGGELYKAGNNRTSYGTDKNIVDTFDDPIYQTQRVGISQYKLDVPDGEYELSLLFAELTGGDAKEALAYNLDNGQSKEQKASDRVFNVTVNGVPFLHNFNIAAEYGRTTPVDKTIRVLVVNGAGITIDLAPVKGKTILNALKLRRIN